jgi:class 3 adenylate cyclase
MRFVLVGASSPLRLQRRTLQRDGHPFGAAVNAAARIAASGGGGEILVADAVRQLAGRMAPRLHPVLARADEATSSARE